MILCLAASLLMSTSGYHIMLIYCCISITYFMVFEFKIKILIILCKKTLIFSGEKFKTNDISKQSNGSEYDRSSHSIRGKQFTWQQASYICFIIHFALAATHDVVAHETFSCVIKFKTGKACERERVLTLYY